MAEAGLVKLLLGFGVVLALAVWELRRTPKHDNRQRDDRDEE